MKRNLVGLEGVENERWGLVEKGGGDGSETR